MENGYGTCNTIMFLFRVVCPVCKSLFPRLSRMSSPRLVLKTLFSSRCSPIALQNERNGEHMLHEHTKMNANGDGTTHDEYTDDDCERNTSLDATQFSKNTFGRKNCVHDAIKQAHYLCFPTTQSPSGMHGQKLSFDCSPGDCSLAHCDRGFQ